MNEREFCFWLQGFFEISQHIDHRQGLTPEAVQEIKNHLKTVFVKVTPSVGVTGPLKTLEDRPGKALEDALREMGRTGTGYPIYPGLQRTVIC